MPLVLSKKNLLNTIANLHLATDGDPQEQRDWPIVNEHFPNYERFWRDLVVPMTTRIEIPVGSPGRHKRRAGVADDLWRVSYLNYSLFLHLTQASDHLPLPMNSSFNDFYAHLGSVCDLAEDFLLAVHVLVSKCRNQPVRFMQRLSKMKFVEIASGWYDKKYPKFYEIRQERKNEPGVSAASPHDR